jgi:hypothetical protein
VCKFENVMATFFTIFNLFAGVASILGVALILFKLDGDRLNRFRVISAIAFALAAILSLYILIVPGSWLESNVRSKFRFYQTELKNEPTGQVLIQRDEFSFKGNNYAIEFPIPFKSTPKVEIINVGGYEDGYIPKVEECTPSQAVVRRSMTGGWPGEDRQVYVWVARGEPLLPVNERPEL